MDSTSPTARDLAKIPTACIKDTVKDEEKTEINLVVHERGARRSVPPEWAKIKTFSPFPLLSFLVSNEGVRMLFLGQH